MISNNDELVGEAEIKRHVSNAEIQIALKLNTQAGHQRKRVGPLPTRHPTPNPKQKGGGSNGTKGEEGGGCAKAVKFTCMEMNECDPVIE